MISIKYLRVFSFLVIIIFPSLSYAGAPNPIAATEITQLLNYGTLLKGVAAAITQVAKQKIMAKALDLHGKVLSDSQWSLGKDALLELGRLIRQGQTIAYSAANISDTISKEFPQYKTHLQKTFNNPNYFRDKYIEWNNINRTTVSNVLRSANLQYKNFVREDSQIRQLQVISLHSKSRMQALQIGHHLATQQISQLQSLRSLVMSQLQMQGNALLTKRDQELMDQAHNEALGQETQQTFINNGEGI